MKYFWIISVLLALFVYFLLVCTRQKYKISFFDNHPPSDTDNERIYHNFHPPLLPQTKNESTWDNEYKDENRESTKQDKYQGTSATDSECKSIKKIDTASSIYYTRHAEERMEERNIKRKDIEKIIQLGHINHNKSSLDQIPCPVFAKQGLSNNNGKCIRVIYEQCNVNNIDNNPSQTSIITTYNLKDNEC